MTSGPTKLQLHRQVCRLILAGRDFAHARDAARRVIEERVRLDSPARFEALQAVAISYGRPFTHNDPIGPIRKPFNRFEQREQRQLHEKLLQMRHGLYAHHDLRLRRVYVIPRGARITPDAEPADDISFGVRLEMPKNDWFTRVAALCEMQIGRVVDQQDPLLDQVCELQGGPPEPIELQVHEETDEAESQPRPTDD